MDRKKVFLTIEFEVDYSPTTFDEQAALLATEAAALLLDPLARAFPGWEVSDVALKVRVEEVNPPFPVRPGHPLAWHLRVFLDGEDITPLCLECSYPGPRGWARVCLLDGEGRKYAIGDSPDTMQLAQETRRGDLRLELGPDAAGWMKAEFERLINSG